ncbi:hypothetical protein FJM67_12090 [Maribrevibacterium harenarium]|uniref:Porin domain-containing protein n=1 Tax=Maribrevibacterium harenarium TaxID=2589817 RepID=A0A501WLP1_9GAMM|nr:hypothetical protein [Maribrevibacterium harenarium]TPE49320.1 hypothetical protein FJM67_12090 [Maribrevibacterium harenarium]
MKAIKLASVFAVTAVAAAVSTATFAAEPVFSGQAGLEMAMLGDKHDDATANGNNDTWGSKGEVNLNIDTGVVSTLIEFRGATATIVSAKVTQGAVSFGDFDGSIADDGYLKADRVIEGEYGDGSQTDLGIRYAVMPGLTVALEMATDQNGVGAAAKYSQDLGVANVTASFGTYAGETTSKLKDEHTIYAIGASIPAGPATVTVSYAGGEYYDKAAKTAEASKVGSVVVGATFAPTDALKLSVQHSMNQEAAKNADDSNTEVAAWFKAGDVTYYAASLTGDKSMEKTVIGAKASF